MKRSTLAWTFALLSCISATVAVAATQQNVRKTAEASMLVTGSLEVNPDGTLHGYTLDHPEKLPPVVVEVIGKSIALWEFKLSASTKDVVKSTMNLRVVAKPVGEGKYNVVVQGASFGQTDTNAGTVSYKDHPSPTYPRLAIDARVSGTVYLLVRVGRDGAVMDVAAEQVNLDQYGTQTDMNKYRKVLADASIDAIRHWTYNLPTKGTAINDPYWVVRVPVNFNLHEVGTPDKVHQYGDWNVYIPGPRQTPSWIDVGLANQSPDATPDGSLATGHSAVQLATRLDGA